MRVMVGVAGKSPPFKVLGKYGVVGQGVKVGHNFAPARQAGVAITVREVMIVDGSVASLAYKVVRICFPELVVAYCE